MVLRYLRYFAVVAAEGSLQRASAKLRVAQPALSRQIKALETEVGATLLERERRGVRLTPAGEALLSGIHDASVRLGQGVQNARLAHQGRLGPIRLGLSRPALNNTRVGAALVAANRIYPEIKLIVSEVSSFGQSTALRGGELDLAVGWNADEDRSLRSELLYDEVIDGVLVGRSHPAAKEEALRPGDLGEMPGLLARDFAHRCPAIPVQLTALGLAYELVDNTDTVFALVAAGVRWTVGSSSFRATPPPGITMKPLSGLHWSLPMTLRSRASDVSQLVANFADAFVSSMNSRDHRSHRPSGRTTPPRVTRQPHEPPRDLELRQLRALVTTLEEKSLSRAGERLGLTQSGVSRQLRALERELDCVLIIRGSKGLTPTVAGEAFRHDAAATLVLVDAAISRARRAARGRSDLCIIGTLPPEMAGGVLANTLKQAVDHHPDIEIEVRELPTISQPAALIAGLIDIGIAGGQPVQVEDPSIASVLLHEDPLDCILISESHPLASRAWLTASELITYPFLFTARSNNPPLYDLVIATFADLGVALNTTEGNLGLRPLWRSVRDTNGWTLGPRSLRAAPPSGLIAVPVEGLHIHWGIRLLWRRHGGDSCVSAILDIFRKARTPEISG